MGDDGASIGCDNINAAADDVDVYNGIHGSCSVNADDYDYYVGGVVVIVVVLIMFISMDLFMYIFVPYCSYCRYPILIITCVHTPVR
jgi:hypothetical protein